MMIYFIITLAYLKDKIQLNSVSGHLSLLEQLAVGSYIFIVQAQNTVNDKLAIATVSFPFFKWPFLNIENFFIII